MLLIARRALRALVPLVCLAAAALGAPVRAEEPADLPPRAYAPLVLGPTSAGAPWPPAATPGDWLGRVNYYRAVAGVALVSEDAALSANCAEHARYVAENDHLTHTQDPSKPYASDAGQICAGKGNVWIGYGTAWAPADSVDSWMASVGHRLWLLYPTTPAFGYGFYSAASREAAALDVLSRANLGADGAYAGWPVRYPAAGQSGVPAGRYPITLLWRYIGATPQITATSLRTAGGAPIAHSADTSLPSGHKGVQIVPATDLPDDTVFEVSVSGTYDGAPFSYNWTFATGAAQPAP
ncbi:MAG TPA: CAP domain-containing protein [Roseiflexaceae bacterium]|nr:CAP domain-containing protein [Roseiflexaceae bacterium]